MIAGDLAQAIAGLAVDACVVERARLSVILVSLIIKGWQVMRLGEEVKARESIFSDLAPWLLPMTLTY